MQMKEGLYMRKWIKGNVPGYAPLPVYKNILIIFTFMMIGHLIPA